MWALVESGSVSKIYNFPKQLTIGDVNYPSNIFTMWTSSELEAIGIYEVVIDNSNLKDPIYYDNTNISYAFASGTVTGSYGTATAKPLDSVLYTAEEEAANANHVEGTVKQYGVRPTKIDEVNGEASNILKSTDWMVVRAAEGGTAVPSSITTKRAAVRTKANAMCTQITNAANVDALAALYIYNDDTPPVRPLGELPLVD